MHIISSMEFIKLKPAKLSIFPSMKPKCTLKVQEQSFILSSFDCKDSFKEKFSVYIEKCLHLVSNFFHITGSLLPNFGLSCQTIIVII